MYPVNFTIDDFTEKLSVHLTHAHTVCTRPSLARSQREGPGDETSSIPEAFDCQGLWKVEKISKTGDNCKF